MWATLTIVLGTLLSLLSFTTVAGYEVLHNRYAGNIKEDDLLGGSGAESEPGEELDGPINVLMLGTDARKENTDDIRSDTIIVLHVPSSHDQAYLISVPRDSYVNVPGYGQMKITEAFGVGFKDIGGVKGGVQLIAKTLQELAGLSFNAAAIVNFDGFEKIIDELGGIEYCVTDEAVSEHYVMVDGERMSVGKAKREGHYWNAQEIRYEEGCQHMEGWQALDYVRQRKNLVSGDGDYGRQRNQQQLLQAMMDQASSSDVRTNLSTLDGLMLAAGDAVTIDTNGVDLIDFLFTVRKVRPGDLISLRTNGGEYNPEIINGKSVELLSEESLAMFQAAADDTMAQFVINHPDFLDSDDQEGATEGDGNGDGGDRGGSGSGDGGAGDA